MEFANWFEVPLPPAEAWPVLLDIERIAPCMPGAELTEVVDHSTFRGNIAIRLGPVALSFAGTIKIDEADEAKHTARISAQGSDAKGRGGVNATSIFRLEPSPAGSRVLVHTNLTLSGSVAQYGRSIGIIQATAAQLISQFAKCLKERLAQLRTVAAAPEQVSLRRAPSRAPVPAAGKPISGLALIVKLSWAIIGRLFWRL